MNKFILHLVAVFFAISSNWIMAAQDTTPIYQVGDAQGTFIQVPLTHDIYRFSHYANLQDLTVLDAEHNALPYRLVAITPQTQTSDAKIITDPLVFFPVAVDATPDTLRKLHTSQTKVQGDKVQIATSDSILNNKNPEFYLIDISKIDHAITSLRIDWDAQADNQYLEVELEATRNLQDWFSLNRATLVQINQHEQHLKHNQIDLDIAKKDYEFLRLKVLRGAEQLHITSITAEQKLGVIAQTQKPSESWRASGQAAKTQTSVYFPDSRSNTFPVAAWEFIRNEATPVEMLGIDLNNYAYGDSVRIFSRNEENQNWQLQYQGIWFNVQVGDQWQTSNAINLYRNSEKFWRVELNEPAKNNAAPTLVFSWEPRQLQIITNNKPPFVLAISNGNYANISHQQVFEQIVSAASPHWIAANLIKLDVQPESIVSAKSVNWKQWIFWAALILAVAVLLLFSLKLFKQIKVAEIPQ